MGDYVVRHLGITPEEADALRQHYWRRYGATLLGLVRHHGVRAAHFLDETHRMPGLEARAARQRPRLRGARAAAGPQVHPDQRAARLCAAGARRAAPHPPLRRRDHDRGHDACSAMPRPKPDARMLRRLAARLRVPRSAASWSKTRCSTRSRRARSACARSGCSAGSAGAQRRIAGSCENGRLAAGKNERRRGHKPAYVCARISSLRKLAQAQ